MAATETLLSVSNLTVRFGQQTVLKNLNFEVKRDETIAIIGPNGAGKTVLFRALLGLIPFSGRINWAPAVRIGYVPQKLVIPADLPLTTLEFFQLKEKDKNKIQKVLANVGLEEAKSRRIGVLSGGELQRVLIAFALLGNPEVLLFDEPTAGVDLSGEETVYSLLRKLQQEENLAIFLISHEIEVVYKYANRVLCLNKEKIYFGPPGEVLNRKNLIRLYGEDLGLYHHRH